MNTYSQTLYKVKKTKSGSDDISQGQPITHHATLHWQRCMMGASQLKTAKTELLWCSLAHRQHQVSKSLFHQRTCGYHLPMQPVAKTFIYWSLGLPRWTTASFHLPILLAVLKIGMYIERPKNHMPEKSKGWKIKSSKKQGRKLKPQTI